MSVNDLRATLPTLTGNWPIKVYPMRPLSGVFGVVLHYTAGPASQTPTQIAAYQTSAAAATQFGGQPAPGLAYHLIVTQDGQVGLANDLDRRVWHSGAVINGISRNNSHIGIVYTGNTEPNPAQIQGIAVAIKWCQDQLGRPLMVEGHRDAPYSTQCPGPSWPGWKAAVLDALDRLAQPVAGPPLTDAERDQLFGEIATLAGNIKAAADRLREISLSESFTVQESLDEGWRIIDKLVPSHLADVRTRILKIKG